MMIFKDLLSALQLAVTTDSTGSSSLFYLTTRKTPKKNKENNSRKTGYSDKTNRR